MRASVVLIALAALVVPAALAAGAPHVRLTDTEPARVTGTGFRPAESVAVTVAHGAFHVHKVVRSTSGGAFVARFTRSIPVGGCAPITVLAVGAAGDRAGWKSPPGVCGAPPTDPTQ